jgi:hypothetical protein
MLYRVLDLDGFFEMRYEGNTEGKIKRENKKRKS